MRHILRAMNLRKVTGLDGVPGRVLKECADKLAGVFMKIFNLFLCQSVILPCLKFATIIPLPKINTISSLSNYCQMAVTPIIMKCFQKVVTGNHIIMGAILSTDPSEHWGSYERVLFIDFSSAFNTIITLNKQTGWQTRLRTFTHTGCLSGWLAVTSISYTLSVHQIPNSPTFIFMYCTLNLH